MQPFLKWAGGKRWLVASSEPFVPESINTYLEPFLGSAAVFFHLQPKKAILSDLNPDLIELYRVIRDNPCELRDEIKKHHDAHGKDYYYRIRDNVPDQSIHRAARMLYLNRTCWNGLYRVNLKGRFNVPIGSKSSVFVEDENFNDYSDVLLRAEISCCDFEFTIDRAVEGDFVFVDPPYTVQHNLNGFLKYNEKIFSWADQERLRDAVQRAVNRGAYVLVTNADHSSVRDLYKDVLGYKQIARSSVLAADKARRGKVTEALFYGGFNLQC